MINAEELGRKVVLARKKRGMKAEDMAEALGIARNSLYRREHGTHAFTALEIAFIAEVLEFDVGYFYTPGTPPIHGDIKTPEKKKAQEIMKLLSLFDRADDLEAIRQAILQAAKGRINTGDSESSL